MNNERGTIKKPKDMKGKICLQPFTNIDIHSDSVVRVCSDDWMAAHIGNIADKSLGEVWNSDIIQKIRKSILDGTYEYCDWHQCPFYCNESHYLYTMEELEADKMEIYRPWIEQIKQGKTKLDIMPANYHFAYDETCNFECPSCRSSAERYTKGDEYEKRLHIHTKLTTELSEYGYDKIRRINLSGSGDPFASKIYREFLFNFDGRQCPDLDINIQSNGSLFTPDTWEKMEKIQGNINEVLISLDAATEKTYKSVRKKGNFNKLIDNIAFMSELRETNKIRRLMLAFVVQRDSYKEMVDALKIAKKYNIDLFLFNLLNDWQSWSKEDFEKNAIWKKHHPEFNDFIEVLKDPIFDEDFIDLGNMIEYRMIAKGEG